MKIYLLTLPMLFTFSSGPTNAHAYSFWQAKVQGGKREIASVKDVGVIGPAGEVILYYKDADSIIVKACEPNTILGKTPEEARANCQGKTSKVPVETFKQAIRNLVSIDRLQVLKPLTAEEVKAYLTDGASSDQIEAMVTELEKINKFIATYGAENANLVRKEELVKALRSQESRISAMKKINSEIEKTVSLIADQAKLTLTKSSTDKDQFLYTVLKQFGSNPIYPCGLKGSVEERIKDCSYQPNSEKEGFVLVTRSKDFRRVYKELSSDLIWSDRLPFTETQFDAEKACNSLKEVAGIAGKTWRLPSKEEFEQAERNGIRKALPNMQVWYWTSSVRDDYNFAWVFVGGIGNEYPDYRILDVKTYLDGKTFSAARKSDYSVRCVAR